jgi:hypothetical protein
VLFFVTFPLDSFLGLSLRCWVANRPWNLEHLRV